MYILIIAYWLAIVYGAIQHLLRYNDVMIALGLMLIALIIQDWRDYDSKTKFRE